MPELTTTVAAVRGAIQVADNRAELVQAATARLLTELVARNALAVDQIVSAIFTATPDLNADFPAHAARRLGWLDVPLLGAVEMLVPGALPRVVRVLLTVSGVPAGRRLEPVYLDGASALRPDLARAPRAAGDGDAKCTLAIIGLGQIGGSIGLALARRGDWRRVGFDADARTMQRALELGVVDQAAASLAEACVAADLAVIATPVDVLAHCVASAAEALPPGAALVDTGSARAGVNDALREAARRGVRAVGGHPLAGNEGRGLDSARAQLFVGTRFVVCPAGDGVPEIVETLIEAIGATPLRANDEEHDAALARTSHLPYLVARALDVIGGEAAARGLSGPAFRDMTRVARSDPRVAEAYCRANLAEVRASWTALRDEMEALLERLGGRHGEGNAATNEA
jgi:monofunctional chorismate mutase